MDDHIESATKFGLLFANTAQTSRAQLLEYFQIPTPPKEKCNYSLRLPYQPFTNFLPPTPPFFQSFSYIHSNNHAPPTSLAHMTPPPSPLALLIPPSSTNPSPALFSRQHTNHTQLPPPYALPK